MKIRLKNVFFSLGLGIITLSCKQPPVELEQHILTPMFDKQVSIDSLLLQTKTIIDASSTSETDTIAKATQVK
ncbi:hypothetical protein ACYSNM_04050 [Myroides sp. LJL116]